MAKKAKPLPPTFEQVVAEYADLWQSMTIRKDRKAAARAAAKAVLDGKARYLAVEGQTGVPWYVVGIIHKMECACHFGKHLHNGDPLTDKTVQVPAGRPAKGQPPFPWEYSACDALRYDKLDRVNEWTVERIAFELEKYNGWGVRLYRHQPTAYLWSFTNHYTAGKYIRDGVWSPTAVSKQTGAMALLAVLMEMDPTVRPPVAIAAPEAIDETETLPKAPAEPDAPDVTLTQLAKTSRKASLVLRTQQALGGIVGGFGTLTVADAMGQAQEISNAVRTVLADNIVLVLVVGGLAVWGVAALIGHYVVDDKRSGRYIESGAE